MKSEFPLRPPIPLFPERHDAARQQRRRLLAVASALIEEGGVEAASLEAVARRAECSQALLQQHFPTHDDLLVALLDDYYLRVQARAPEPDTMLREALRTAAQGSIESLRAMLAHHWDATFDAGLGASIVRATPHFSHRLRFIAEESRHRHERWYLDPLTELGISRVAAESVLDAIQGLFVSLSLRVRNREIEREEALEIFTRSYFGMVSALAPDL